MDDLGSESARDQDVTFLLSRCVAGESGAFSELAEQLYPQLRKIAEVRLRSERPDHTLQPTALVNEFFVNFARNTDLNWRNRAHFLAVASRAMRRILIDYARAVNSQKRGGGILHLELDGLEAHDGQNLIDAIEIDSLLERLMLEEPRMANVVEMKCFGGLTYAEIGEALQISEKTVKRDWQVARAWLFGQLRKRP